MSPSHANVLRRTKVTWIILCGFVSLITVCSAFGQTGSYGSRWIQAPSLYPGVKYAHYDAASPSDPRTNQINCLQIDTTTPGLKFYTNPRCSPYVADSKETVRCTTRNFVSTSQTTDKKIVAAINANFYYTSSSFADLRSLAVSDGIKVSAGEGLSSFVVSKQGVPSIVYAPPSYYNTSNVQTAVSGGIGSEGGICLSNGTISGGVGDSSLNPRTAVGISQDSRYVYFMTIDGRQTASNCAYLQDVGSYLKYFGSYNGLNLDGGGSTSMAWWNPSSSSAELLNVPSETRSVGNSIGVYYVPEPSNMILLATVAVAFLGRMLLRRGKTVITH